MASTLMWQPPSCGDHPHVATTHTWQVTLTLSEVGLGFLAGGVLLGVALTAAAARGVRASLRFAKRLHSQARDDDRRLLQRMMPPR